jgi:hypothetical protein
MKQLWKIYTCRGQHFQHRLWSVNCNYFIPNVIGRKVGWVTGKTRMGLAASSAPVAVRRRAVNSSSKKIFPLCVGRENFIQVDEFMILRFAATGTLRAAGRMRVLQMTHHASWKITFGMKENNCRTLHGITLMHGSLFILCQQLSVPWAICYQLTVGQQCGKTWFAIL